MLVSKSGCLVYVQGGKKRSEGLGLIHLSCRKRVWIKYRNAKRVGAFCWNKWAGGGRGADRAIVFL